MTLHFSKKQKKFYHVGNVECSLCGLLIEQGGLLRELFNFKKQCLKQTICVQCVGNGKVKQASADCVRHTFFVCVEKQEYLPTDCVPVFLSPPELSSGYMANTFQAVSPDFDKQFNGGNSAPVRIIDSTKWSFKNQCEQIDMKEHQRLLQNRLKELDEG